MRPIQPSLSSQTRKVPAYIYIKEDKPPPPFTRPNRVPDAFPPPQLRPLTAYQSSPSDSQPAQSLLPRFWLASPSTAAGSCGSAAGGRQMHPEGREAYRPSSPIAPASGYTRTALP